MDIGYVISIQVGIFIQYLPSGVIKHGVLENGPLIGDFPS